MSRKRLVREYTPDFAAGNYKPGEAKMGRHGGKSVANNSLGSIGYNADSELTSHGEQWPRKHSKTVGMSDVDDNGVDSDSQGGHASSVGKPVDGHTKQVSHNWPKKAKNSGGTTAMKGTRYTDGGVLGSGGVSDVSEGWTPNKISTLLGEEQSVQQLFNKYAKNREWVCLESFGQYCQASGCPCRLDLESFESLMDQNRDFVFYEGQDSDGYYWTPLVEDMNEFDGFDDEDDDYEDDVDDDIDNDGIDDEMDMDFDDELTGEEHHDLHAKIRDFCDKYGCPEEELHELCHEYAQTPMNDEDEDDFGGDADEGMEDDEFGDEDYEEDDELVGPFDESACGSMGESMDESMDESWSESACHSCNSSPCQCDECESCSCSPCECSMESRKPRRAIRESRKRPSPKSRQPRRK
jgi:hypothetical protein